MAGSPINFPPIRGQARIADPKTGVIDKDAHRDLLDLFDGFPLITVSTAGGPATIPIPLAKFNQNVEIVYVKTSNDANLPTLATSGSDLINSVGAWAATTFAMGTARGSKVRIKSDGVSNWYVVG
jgi:hypothetical protein